MAYSIGDLCIGCTICQKNCPVLAISGTLKEKHVINQKRCVECGVCGRVCQKGAVLDASDAPCKSVPKAQWKKPAIDASLCSACSMCVSVCRAGALSIGQPVFRGDIDVTAILSAPEKCVACGLCEMECPLHAIRLQEVQA